MRMNTFTHFGFSKLIDFPFLQGFKFLGTCIKEWKALDEDTDNKPKTSYTRICKILKSKLCSGEWACNSCQGIGELDRMGDRKLLAIIIREIDRWTVNIIREFGQVGGREIFYLRDYVIHLSRHCRGWTKKSLGS